MMNALWKYLSEVNLIDFVLHINVHLGKLLDIFGGWTYAIIFLIIFCETGLVVTPFLPGDSLLFAIGAFAASGAFGLSGALSPQASAFALAGTIAAAAIIGDTVNYWIGRRIGPKVFSKENVRFLNKKHLERTHAFYEKHGGKTIIIARFIPIVRTFSPFVAGIGRIPYPRFIAYSLVGGALWVTICMGAGYFFGNLEIVKKNFSVVILAIIFISILPAIVTFLRERSKGKSAAPAAAAD